MAVTQVILHSRLTELADKSEEIVLLHDQATPERVLSSELCFHVANLGRQLLAIRREVCDSGSQTLSLSVITEWNRILAKEFGLAV